MEDYSKALSLKAVKGKWVIALLAGGKPRTLLMKDGTNKQGIAGEYKTFADKEKAMEHAKKLTQTIPGKKFGIFPMEKVTHRGYIAVGVGKVQAGWFFGKAFRTAQPCRQNYYEALEHSERFLEFGKATPLTTQEKIDKNLAAIARLKAQLKEEAKA